MVACLLQMLSCSFLPELLSAPSPTTPAVTPWSSWNPCSLPSSASEELLGNLANFPMAGVDWQLLPLLLLQLYGIQIPGWCLEPADGLADDVCPSASFAVSCIRACGEQLQNQAVLEDWVSFHILPGLWGWHCSELGYSWFLDGAFSCIGVSFPHHSWYRMSCALQGHATQQSLGSKNPKPSDSICWSLRVDYDPEAKAHWCFIGHQWTKHKEYS